MSRTSGKVLALVGDEAKAGGMLSVLEAGGFDVLEVRSGEEAIARAASERPAAVLLDLDGHESSVYLACKILRERSGDLLAVVLLSGERTTASDRVVALLLGADDYLVKPVDPSELAARLHRLVARSAAHRKEAAFLSETSDVDDFDLTKRERDVMVRLFVGKTQPEIASELVISPSTVATHIQRILLKLGVHNRAQAVAKVAHAGWLEREPVAGGRGGASRPKKRTTSSTAPGTGATTPPTAATRSTEALAPAPRYEVGSP